MALDTTIGGAASDAYITHQEAQEYGQRMGLTGWTVESTPESEAAIRRATRWLDSTYAGQWIGTPADAEQALAWPRSHTSLPNDLIPNRVKEAVAEIAHRELRSPNSMSPDYTPSQMKKSVKVGPISTEYANTYEGANQVRVPVVDMILRPLLVEDWADSNGTSTNELFRA